LRFGIEPLRLSTMAASALRRLGAAHPEQHMVVISLGFTKMLLVKRAPWRPDELAALDRVVDESPVMTRGITLPAMDNLFGALSYLYAPHRPTTDGVYAWHFGNLAAGRTPPIVVPTDDRPYYFSAEWVDYFRGRPVSGPVGTVLALYGRFMLVLCVVAVLAILLPPALRRRRGARARGAAPTLAYFFSLGLCFMFLEIGLIQKAILVVEHPAYSIAVVMAALLVATALGSLLSQRLRWPLGRIVLAAAAGIAVVGGVYTFALNPLMQALMPLRFGVRMTLCALAIAPLGVALGMLFPTGLRRLSAGAGAPLLPWAIAVNGFASVIGSIVSVPFAVLFGFTALFGAGVAVYLLGCLAFFAIPSAPAAGASGAAPAARA
jgi:hypothetical protein